MVSLVMRLQMVMVWVLGSWTMKYIMGNLDDRESPSLSDFTSLFPLFSYQTIKQYSLFCLSPALHYNIVTCSVIPGLKTCSVLPIVLRDTVMPRVKTCSVLPAALHDTGT